jgi:hypothetical protein
MHKFKVGQIVQFRPDQAERSNAISGPCLITRQLPQRRGEFDYRIKSSNEEYERIARESQLTEV